MFDYSRYIFQNELEGVTTLGLGGIQVRPMLLLPNKFLVVKTHALSNGKDFTFCMELS